MKIFVKYDTRCYTDYHDGEEYGSWEKSGDFWVDGVYSRKNGYGYEEFDTTFKAKIGDRVYVLWIKYGTGDSFGHESGRGEIMWVFKNVKVAEAAAKAWREQTEHYRENHEYSVVFEDDNGDEVKLSNPAAGYFESLESVNVDSFLIEY